MDLGFWSKLKLARTNGNLGGKPIMVLAPMADVTDSAFRRIIAKYSKWGGRNVSDEEARSHFAQEGYAGQVVMWTEFVSADGLCHPEGRKKLLIDLSYTEAERPIVAQLFSGNPEKMFEAAKLVAELGFDGLDINMGCPDRSIEKSGAGACLMKNPNLARAIIRSAKEGVRLANGQPGIPVSVKTRIGYNKNELDSWLPELLAEEPAVITIHARTRKEMSDVPARWSEVKRAVEIRDALKSKTLIFGNGDVTDLVDAGKKAKETGADGIMLGRAIFGNPWLFSQSEISDKNEKPNDKFSGMKLLSNSHELDNSLERERVRTKLAVMVEHTKLFEKLFKNVKNFSVMKKHYKAYVQGFDGAKELRIKLMETQTASEVETLVSNFLAS